MATITPHLWFDTQAREAAEFYSGVFPDSAVTSVTTLRGTPSGECDVVSFRVFGRNFQAISAGPYFTINGGRDRPAHVRVGGDAPADGEPSTGLVHSVVRGAAG